MVNVDTRQLDKYVRDLKTYAAKAYPFATRWSLHLTSKRAVELAKERVSATMVLRNKRTLQSIQYAPQSANGMTLNVRRQMSFAGSIEDYLATQEFGGTKRRPVIPTSWSAGQDGAKPRTKLPLPARKMSRIKLAPRTRKVSSRAQRNIVAVRMAIKTNERYVLLDFGGRTRGLYRVVGGSIKSSRSGWPRGVVVKQVHSLAYKSVTIPRTQWLYPASLAAQAEMPRYYRDAILYQLRRRKLLI